MGVQSRVLEAAAEHPIHAGRRGVAVQGKLSFLPEGEESLKMERSSDRCIRGFGEEGL